MNYLLSEGQGILQKGVTKINPDTFNKVDKGSFSYNFTPTTSGTFTLEFQLRDSNGQITSKKITILVTEKETITTFDFTSSSSETEIIPNSSVNINHSINNIQGNQLLEYSYVILEGSGTLKNNNVIQQQNTWYSILNPNDFNDFKNTVFTPTTGVNQNVRIQFKVRNNKGLVKTNQVYFELLYAEIKMIVTSSPTFISGTQGSRHSHKICLNISPKAVKNLKIIGLDYNVEWVAYDGAKIESLQISKAFCIGPCGPTAFRLEVIFSNGKVVKYTRSVDVWNYLQNMNLLSCN